MWQRVTTNPPPIECSRTRRPTQNRDPVKRRQRERGVLVYVVQANAAKPAGHWLHAYTKQDFGANVLFIEVVWGFCTSRMPCLVVWGWRGVLLETELSTTESRYFDIVNETLVVIHSVCHRLEMESGTKNWFFNRQSDQFMCCNGKLHSKVLNVFFCIIIMFLSLWTLTSGKSTPSKYLAENMKEDDGVKDILKQYLNGDEIDRDLHQKVTVLLACFTLATAVIAMTAFLYSSRVVYQCYQYFEAHQKAKRMAEAISEIERSHEI
ncbi:unnamed protein product [Anisakis simplex]|uniref:Col_cuticle_N domain-containing protein n=1 Tax=Anisakis simplex TaxID=6269 RepID=A0A0M3JVG3_ANISI|nr:unnamed protein product [Anisakis simplex]